MTLWNDPANQELKSARRDPNFLMVGDRLHIPPLRSRVEVGHTGSTCHRFVRKGLPNLVHIRFMADGSPLAGQNFRATLNTGRRFTGSLDQEGSLSLSLSESATSVRVMIGNETPMEFSFALGALQPADSHEGIRQRLVNLGVLDPALSDCSMPDFVAAFRQFEGLAGKARATGESDDLVQRLRIEHDDSRRTV
ncbi:MAG: hypothetical protein IPJ27_05540 [Candidatus Accumulibacter sp.]|uniref:Uncharacterized protein n=1 Tax=Candidatus Accumulibacter proximus TaxID=2954385 RepID=A0A935PVT3_9PROT|nr:hypothetical protein [Candidatus Accumulibacter proximus]